MNLNRSTLADPAYARANPAAVDSALARLGCSSNATAPLAEFYRQYAGPFSSEHIGHELLDLVDQHENVVTQTEECRRMFGLPMRYLVISRLLGGSVLAYDCDTGSVFDVDFEGGDEMLRSRTLAPTWASFEEFAASYFLGAESGTLAEG